MISYRSNLLGRAHARPAPAKPPLAPCNASGRSYSTISDDETATVLDVLARGGTVADAARAVGRAHQTIVSLIDRLERENGTQ
jgi:hypothetical protein